MGPVPALQPVVLGATTTAPSDPTIFDSDPLFELGAVLAAQAYPLFALLQIFLNGIDGKLSLLPSYTCLRQYESSPPAMLQELVYARNCDLAHSAWFHVASSPSPLSQLG
ncbi:hypothetical protein EDB84DRAFT_1442289 [Lactarius hengduanensis]|nr:hypothetical protein EDB84DRAFT_1442289 [Lactarius hengduanensis]